MYEAFLSCIVTVFVRYSTPRSGVGLCTEQTVRPSAALLLSQRADLFFTELSPLNDQGILIKGMIRDRS